MRSGKCLRYRISKVVPAVIKKNAPLPPFPPPLRKSFHDQVP